MTPAILAALTRELETCDLSDVKTVMRLPYLNAVCSETLRIYPIAPIAFPRITKTSIRVMDYTFEPGVLLAPCIYLLHHRADLYPNPKAFQPQRFSGATVFTLRIYSLWGERSPLSGHDLCPI